MEKQLFQQTIQGLKEQQGEDRKHQAELIQTINHRMKTQADEEVENHLRKQVEDLANSNQGLEKSLEKCKIYKLLVKYATNLQCARCNKFIANAFFQDHMASCLPYDQNPFKNANTTRDESMITRTLTAINVSISQTMVREYPDTKRPYTEYILQIRTESCQWNVARKYRSFCELHNELTSTYPFVKFPASAKEIFGLSNDLSSILSSRKPTIVEERRKGLQNYLRELLKIEAIRNSPFLRCF